MTKKKFILGTVQLGINYGINNNEGKPSKEMAFSILNCAWKNGIEILDTADVYGDAQAVIGEYHLLTKNIFKINSKFKGNSLPVEVQIEKILNELNIPALNVYFYHSFHDFVNSPNLMSDLVKLKTEGKFKKIGLSVYENSELELAILNPHIDVIQLPFNLFDNINERGAMLKKAKKYNKMIQIRSVYLQGLFFKEISKLPVKLEPLAKHLTTIQRIATNNNISIEQLAIAYATMQEYIDEIIIGVENENQLIENVELFENRYDESIIDEINKINIEEKELLYPKNWN